MRSLLVITTFLLAGLAFAQRPDSAPTLPRDKKLEAEIRKNVPNLRSAMYLIINAGWNRRAQELLLIYRDILAEQPNNPLVKAEYVFAYDQGTIHNEHYPKNLQRVIDYYFHSPYGTEANRLRAESLKELSNEPEIYALEAMHNSDWQRAEKGFVAAKKAVQLDPNWGYAHYILGRRTLGMIETTQNPQQKIKNSKRALQEFAIAQRLEPYAPYIYLNYDYAFAYGMLHQLDKELFYLNEEIAKMQRKHAAKFVLDFLIRWRDGIETLSKKEGRLP